MANGFADRIVTPEVQDVTNQFEDLIEGRDVVGLGFIAIAGAAGVALANEVVDIVVPRLPGNISADPQTSRDFLASGLVQGTWAFVLVGAAGAFLAGSPVLFASAIALSLGSVIIAGANLFEWGQRALASVTNSQPTGAGRSGSRPGTGRSAQRMNPTTDGGSENTTSTSTSTATRDSRPAQPPAAGAPAGLSYG